MEIPVLSAKIGNPDELQLKKRIAENLIYYRKTTGMTQTELAARINYSDKSVSKWERAGGTPDIYVLTLLASLYGVTVNDLISENAPRPPADPHGEQRRRVMVCLLSVVFAWLVTTVLYAALRLIVPEFEEARYIFLLAPPASCVIFLVFASIWWGYFVRFMSVAALIWCAAACLYAIDPQKRLFLLLSVVVPLQILAFLWFMMKKQNARRGSARRARRGMK
ncbi:MAG: helix-turn-helix domain-containing protein [Oscillospiraceae bacterium]|jgi:transcriptional regulator with XRE-family HTH domain|nr:helix-turn-helix domain-containing protein [Oscillospiraceae bacterium]